MTASLVELSANFINLAQKGKLQRLFFNLMRSIRRVSSPPAKAGRIPTASW
jgi:hypothetical protein